MSRKYLTNTYLNSPPSQLNSTPEPNGQTVFTKLETNNVAVHAGLSVLLKLSVIDYVLPQTVTPISSSPHNTPSLVTVTTTVVKVVTSTRLGTSSKAPVSQVMHVSHTPLVPDVKEDAQLNVLTDLSSNSTLLEMSEPTNLLKTLRLISLPMVQLKPVSKYMKIS